MAKRLVATLEWRDGLLLDVTIEISREQIRRALAATTPKNRKVEVDVKELERELRGIGWYYYVCRAGKTHHPAVLDQLDAPLKHIQAARAGLRNMPWLKNSIKEWGLIQRELEINRMIIEDNTFLTAKEKVHTELWFQLYALYVRLTSKTGLGDEDGEGPLYEFAKECAGIIDPSIDSPAARAFKKALQRRITENKEQGRPLPQAKVRHQTAKTDSDVPRGT
jgi:hypothetical protein